MQITSTAKCTELCYSVCIMPARTLSASSNPVAKKLLPSPVSALHLGQWLLVEYHWSRHAWHASRHSIQQTLASSLALCYRIDWKNKHVYKHKKWRNLQFQQSWINWLASFSFSTGCKGVILTLPACCQSGKGERASRELGRSIDCISGTLKFTFGLCHLHFLKP